MVRRGPHPSQEGQTPAGTVVLDCSVALSWFFKDEASAYADGVARSLKRFQAIVPAIWPLEVANTVVVGERRGRSTEQQATRFLTLLNALPIRVDAAGKEMTWTATVAVARRFGLSAYDAAYLELAIRAGGQLATGDQRLAAAAEASGVSLFEIPAA